MASLVVAQIGMTIIAVTLVALGILAMLGLEPPEKKTPLPVAIALMPIALFLLYLVFFLVPNLFPVIY